MQSGSHSTLEQESYEGRWRVHAGRLEGWARNLDDWRTPVVVEVLQGGAVAARLEATEPREHLRGNTRCGFSLDLPGAAGEIEVRIAGTAMFLLPEGGDAPPDAVSRPDAAAVRG